MSMRIERQFSMLQPTWHLDYEADGASMILIDRGVVILRITPEEFLVMSAGAAVASVMRTVRYSYSEGRN
jgi:hypothetical protein